MSSIPGSSCDLLITGGRILDLGAEVESLWRATRVIDATGQVIGPGFIDAHVHLGAFLDTARPYQPSTGPGPFSGGGRIEVILPMIARMCSMSVPDQLVAAVVRPALVALLKAGITGVVDAGGPGVGGVVSAAAELGIRAAVGPSLADMWHDEQGRLVRQAEADRLLDQARAAIDSYDRAGNGWVRAVVSGVETMGCSDQLLAGIAELTAARDVVTHLHSHVSGAAVQAHDAAFGRTATRRLSAAGLLSPRCTLMHAGSLADDDIAAFAETGVTVNYNPGGNALFGFGVTAGHSVPRILDAGVPVVLGSDTAPTFALSTPFDMTHAALMLQRDLARRDDALSLEQALAMATNSGPSLGRPGQLGRVTQGQFADLVLLDTAGPHHLGTDHPVPALALHARTADIAMVIVDGRVVVEHGDLVGSTK